MPWPREYCTDTAMEPAAVLLEWQKKFGKKMFLQDPGSCEHCSGTGYSGRVGFHELLVMDARTRKLVHQRAAASEIRAQAINAGMRTLRQDGIEKVLAGHTDMPEVRATAA